mmetsp:Transcript_1355/g.4613  ORF Transcript_1355/g.4613 Transcript_1355/m.4613 type:complete len:813 (+) Transcript_1355:56-2494(+)
MASAADLGAFYRKKSEEGRLGAKEKQACKLYAEADEHFSKEAVEEALHAAKQSAELFKEAGFKSGVPDALRLVARLLSCQGKKEDACKLAKDELAKFRASGDKLAEAKMLLAIAEVNKDSQEAVQSATEAMSLFKSQGEAMMEAAAALALSGVHLAKEGDEKKRAKEAQSAAAKAKELSIQLGDKKGEAQALHAVAAALALEGAMDDALASADEALDLYLELKNRKGEAFELLALAGWKLKSNRAKKALSDAEEALEIYQALGSPKEKEALTMVFEAHMAKGNMAKATRVVSRALNRYQDSGDRGSEAEALAMLVKLYCEDGKFEEALSMAEKACAIFQDMGNQKQESAVAGKIAELHLNLENYDKALQSGEDALTLLKELGTSEEKVEAMFTMVDAYLQKGSHQEALDLVTDVKKDFQSAGDTKSEAKALMTLCSVQLMMEGFEAAVGAATRAQSIFSEEGDQKNEANALCMLSEAHARKGECKMAVKAAERARAVFKELEDREGEAAALYRMAANNIQLAVQEGASASPDAALSRAAGDALDKGMKTSETALKISRELLPQGHQELLGCVLSVHAKSLLLKGKAEDALRSADEAVVLFREIGAVHSEADALHLSAYALGKIRQYQESRDAANEALALYRQTSDEAGEEEVTQLIGSLEEIQQQLQAQWMQQQMAQNPQMFQQQQQMPMMQMNMFAPQEGGGGMPDQATSVARTDRERGPALDLSAGIDEAMVKGKVLEIATRITGAEDGEIEADTPLMEAGLTSNSAILLRDELSQELPGINLPVTLVFDYPSISAMAELIVESSQKAVK